MKPRTLFSALVFAAILCSLLALSARPAAAQVDEKDVVRFSALGEKEILLDGPIDSTSIDFYLPAHWQLLAGGTVHLNMRAFIGEDTAAASGNTAAGFIEVYLNDTWVDTIALTTSGNYSLDLAIPAHAWDLTEPHAPQSLRLYLHDAIRCGLLWISAQGGTWRGINVAISPTSYLILPHREVPVPTDLRLLPFPIQQSSFLPDRALLIVPAFPSESELQAALTVAAALGRMTNNQLQPVFLTADRLTADQLAGAHAIFVGDPAGFAPLAGIVLPAAVAAPQAGPDDGLLQMIVSPVNPATVWLTVSGNSPVGLVKAAQAFGSGQVRIHGPENLAVVTDVVPQPVSAMQADMTLAEMGYDEQTYSGYGIRYFAYWFDIPSVYQVSEGAYFELVFNNSALLNYDESGITVLLNDLFVGGVRLSDRTTNTSTTRFQIPAYMFRAGRNLLLLEVNLSGITPCIPYEEIWVSVKPGSLLHMPSVLADQVARPQPRLTDYPALLFPTAESLTFVLPREDVGAWQMAARLAGEIGAKSGGRLIAPGASYADTLPLTRKENESLIVIGRASQLPLMTELSAALPAPFESGRDIASEPNREFIFNVPENVSVGYLQVLPSPWNNRRVILAVNANDLAGLSAAVNVLSDSNLRAGLRGNLAVIYGQQVLVAQIETTTPAVAATPAVTVLGTPEAPAGSETGPFRIDLLTVGLAILGLIIVLALITRAVSRGKRKKA